jgi:ectoine hydroxylase-related dioxygenase (phytanoyl-CoA dioxygenase family)
MPKRLSPRQIDQYRQQGYVSPLTAFSMEEALAYRCLLEAGERVHDLAADRRRKMYLYLKWADGIVRDPRVLDAVEDLIGPDILVYHLTLWMKEPRTDAFVSWHQDSTYFGLSPAEHVTAWVALSESGLESGCVQVVPGSHLRGQIPHGVEKSDSNMFPTGQRVALGSDVPLDTMVLRPGEFSLHHTHLLHNSLPNRSVDRRIGLGISYIPTRCRCSARQRLSASLVRGTDRFGHFDLDPAPVADYDQAGIAVHAEAMRRWHAARAELIPAAHAEAAGAG